MEKKVIILLLATTLTGTILTGCGNQKMQQIIQKL